MDSDLVPGEPEPALARPRSPPMSTVVCWTRHISLLLMFGTGTVLIAAFLASKDQQHPLLHIGRLPLHQFFYILQGAWAFFGIYVLFITIRYCQHPLWDSLHFFTILGIQVYFIQYLQFEWKDIPFFFPFAADMGIVIAVILKKINDSCDRGVLRSIWNRLMGYRADDGRGGNEDGRDGRDGLNLTTWVQMDAVGTPSSVRMHGYHVHDSRSLDD